MIDPRTGTIALDANALDQDGTERDALVRRFVDLAEAGRIAVALPGGVRTEVQNPRTPGPVQNALLPRPIGLPTRLSQGQQITRIRVRAILRGDARPGKHEADAAHLCAAAEIGCAYFITHDKRILKKRADLRSSLPSLAIVTLAKFFESLDRFERERPLGREPNNPAAVPSAAINKGA